MTEDSWNTAITRIAPNEVRLRGYRIDDLMGQISFTSGIYLALIGELPSPEINQLLDALLISSIDHGASPPSALAARTSASTGAPMNAAISAGLLSINRFHGAAIEGCMETIQVGLRRVDEQELSIGAVASQLVAEYSANKQRLPGLGHRVHDNDPRTTRLFMLADDLGLAGEGIQMLLALQRALAETGKDLPINVDGAIAAVLVDLQIPFGLANAFFYIARLPGLVAQVYEEQTRMRPMRRIHPTAIEYDGPEDRDL